MLGTATLAEQWLVIEHPGPWGPRVLEDTLPEPLKTWVQAWTSRHPEAKVLLARDPSHHPARDVDQPRWIWFADCSTGPVADNSPGLIGARLDLRDAEALLLGRVEPGRVLDPADGAWFGVCTNGRRDRCCALSGAPLAQAGAELFPGRVWEVSHVGGHRFAPVVLQLPHGYLHGRVSDIAALVALTDRGDLAIESLRGRSSRAAKDQVVEGLGRSSQGRWGLDEWSSDDQQAAALACPVSQVQGDPRPESCGAEPSAYMCWLPS